MIRRNQDQQKSKQLTTKTLKYIFIGGGRGGFELISSATANNVLPEYSVICKEDDHEHINYSEKMKELLEKNDAAYSVRKKLTETDHEIIRKIRPDLIFVFGWRTMIDPKLNSNCRYGIFAAHYSLLPKYRGFAPMQWAIINGEKSTGVSIFRIEEGGVDSGKILIRKKILINENDYASDIEKKLTGLTVDTFISLIKKKTLNIRSLIKQDESKATYTCKRTPEDGRINWNKSSSEIFNLIRALSYPYTGAFCFYENEKFVIRKAESGKKNKFIFKGIIAGRVIHIDETGIEVLCGTGTLKITEWDIANSGKTEIPSVRVRSYSDTLL